MDEIENLWMVFIKTHESCFHENNCVGITLAFK